MGVITGKSRRDFSETIELTNVAKRNVSSLFEEDDEIYDARESKKHTEVSGSYEDDDLDFDEISEIEEKTERPARKRRRSYADYDDGRDFTEYERDYRAETRRARVERSEKTDKPETKSDLRSEEDLIFVAPRAKKKKAPDLMRESRDRDKISKKIKRRSPFDSPEEARIDSSKQLRFAGVATVIVLLSVACGFLAFLYNRTLGELVLANESLERFAGFDEIFSEMALELEERNFIISDLRTELEYLRQTQENFVPPPFGNENANNENENGTETPQEPVQRTHTVAPGENLNNIARQYFGENAGAEEINKIVAANNIENPSLISPGQILIIPD